jgi:DNA-directed RNA polymerase specialized sigma24 family protein
LDVSHHAQPVDRRGPCRNPPWPDFLDEDAGVAVGADGGQEARAQLSDVDRAMARCEEQREALLLVMVEGRSYKEAAEIVGCPVGTLNSRLVRGRDALLAMLETSCDALSRNPGRLCRRATR